MRVWITTYALTQGILVEEAEATGTCATVTNLRYGRASYWGHNWHKSQEEAVAYATVIRDRKIAGLKKQIAKLEALEL